MKGFIQKIKKAWPYIVYALAVVLFFLFLFFPERLVTSFITKRFSAAFPGSGMSAEKVAVLFPPGIEIVSPVFSMRNGETLNAGSIRLRPSMLSLLGISKSFRADINAFGGNAVLNADLKDVQSIDKAGLNIKNVDISKIPKSFLKGYDIRGMLDADVDLKAGGKGHDGTFSIRISSGSIGIPFLPGFDMSPATADLEGVIQQDAADINKGVFTAGIFSGNVSGKVDIAFPAGKSALDLAVNVKRNEGEAEGGTASALLDAVFKAGSMKKIVVTGTVDNPKYSFK